MSRRRRLRWPWWVGGIIAVLIVSAYVDFKYVFPALSSRTDAELYPGAVGRVSPVDIACFPTSGDVDAFTGAAWRRDTSGERAALRAAIFLTTGAHVQALDRGGAFKVDLFVHVLDGGHRGQDCWIRGGERFADIAVVNDAMQSCVDEQDFDRIVSDLRRFDASTDASTRTAALAQADHLIEVADQDVQCQGGQTPDDFSLATAWSAADDIRQEQVRSGSRGDRCRLDAERGELSSAWMAVYDHQETSDRPVLDGALSAIRATASSVSLPLPQLTIDGHAASRFEADQKARADARYMGLPC